MRLFRHWTPRYVWNRIETIFYEKRYPDHPWLTKDANQFLDSFLKQDDVGLEFGSGRSTIWIARRVGRLHSVETNPQWSVRVSQMLEQANLLNVAYEQISGENEQELEAEHERLISEIVDSSLDFCLVDGDCRGICALLSTRKLRPGGILIIDNVERYLPSASISPVARTLEAGPADDIWSRVEKSLWGWRRYWTSNGVSDTAIFFKPTRVTEET